MNLRLRALLLPALLLGLPLYGQIQPKTMFAGGNYELNTDLDDYGFLNTTTEAGIVTDGAFALGARILRSFAVFDSEFLADRSRWGGALFARYYLPQESATAFFVHAEAGLENLNLFLEDRNGDNDFEENTSTVSFRMGLGMNNFIAPTAAFETVAGFFWSQTEDADARWGVSADLGLRLFLPVDREKMGKSGPALTAGMSMVGANGSFTGELSDDNFFSLNLNPDYGYLLTPFFMIGAEAQYFTATDAGNIVALRPLLRFYLNPQSRFMVFLTGVGGFEYQSNDSVSKTLWQLRAGPGINHFLTPDLALEAFLGYRSRDLSDELNNELIATLGIRAFLGGEATVR